MLSTMKQFVHQYREQRENVKRIKEAIRLSKERGYKGVSVVFNIPGDNRALISYLRFKGYQVDWKYHSKELSVQWS